MEKVKEEGVHLRIRLGKQSMHMQCTTTCITH